MTYVGSMGAGNLWRTVARAQAGGGKAVLAAVPPIVRKVLDMVGFSEEVAMVDWVEEALRSFAP